MESVLFVSILLLGLKFLYKIEFIVHFYFSWAILMENRLLFVRVF